MAEWLKAHAWKACLLERVTWVRIPLSPPSFDFCYLQFVTGNQIPIFASGAVLSTGGNVAVRLYRQVGKGKVAGPYFLRYSLADGTRPREAVGDDLDSAIDA
jgi:hypothetical protein